jgi:hypothetical protein
MEYKGVPVGAMYELWVEHEELKKKREDSNQDNGNNGENGRDGRDGNTGGFHSSRNIYLSNPYFRYYNLI